MRRDAKRGLVFTCALLLVAMAGPHGFCADAQKTYDSLFGAEDEKVAATAPKIDDGVAQRVTLNG